MLGLWVRRPTMQSSLIGLFLGGQIIVLADGLGRDLGSICNEGLSSTTNAFNLNGQLDGFFVA